MQPWASSMRRRTGKNGKPCSKPWLSPSSRYAWSQLLLISHTQSTISWPCPCPDTSAGLSVEEKICHLFYEWGPCPGVVCFASAESWLLECFDSDPPWKPIGFLPLEKPPVGFCLGTWVLVPLETSSPHVPHFSRALISFLCPETL